MNIEILLHDSEDANKMLPEELMEHFTDDNSYIIAGYELEIPVCIAFFSCHDETETAVDLEYIYVLPECRYTGLGSELLENSEEILKEAGIDLIRLKLGGADEDLIPLVGLFAENGYTPVLADGRILGYLMKAIRQSEFSDIGREHPELMNDVMPGYQLSDDTIENFEDNLKDHWKLIDFEEARKDPATYFFTENERIRDYVKLMKTDPDGLLLENYCLADLTDPVGFLMLLYYFIFEKYKDMSDDELVSLELDDGRIINGCINKIGKPEIIQELYAFEKWL